MVYGRSVIGDVTRVWILYPYKLSRQHKCTGMQGKYPQNQNSLSSKIFQAQIVNHSLCDTNIKFTVSFRLIFYESIQLNLFTDIISLSSVRGTTSSQDPPSSSSYKECCHTMSSCPWERINPVGREIRNLQTVTMFSDLRSPSSFPCDVQRFASIEPKTH